MKLVKDWRSGWKWFSNWAFVLVLFLTAEPLPPELVTLLPVVVQDNLIRIVAAAGLILRFVGQSRQVRSYHE